MKTGNSIIQVVEEIEEIKKDDMFIISEPDIYLKDKRNTKNLRYQSLLEDLSCKIFDRFGTMIYETSSDYSPSNHRHDDKYNHLDCIKYINYTPDVSVDLSIGEYFIDGKLLTLYMPLSCAERQVYIVDKDKVEPKIGSFKFQTIGNLDQSTGWVLADGSSYILDEYEHKQELEELYGNDNGEFTVPSIQDFLKIDNNSQVEYLHYSPYHVYTPDHSHNVNINVEGRIEIDAYISCSSSPGKGEYAHNGVKPDEKNTSIIQSGKYTMKFKPNITISGGKVTYSESNLEVYPNHQKTSLYVYIGGKV